MILWILLWFYKLRFVILYPVEYDFFTKRIPLIHWICLYQFENLSNKKKSLLNGIYKNGFFVEQYNFENIIQVYLTNKLINISIYIILFIFHHLICVTKKIMFWNLIKNINENSRSHLFSFKMYEKKLKKTCFPS